MTKTPQSRPQASEEILRWRALELLFSQNFNASAGGYVCLAIVCWGFWGNVPWVVLTVWGIAYSAVVYYRLHVIHLYSQNEQRSSSALPLWHRRLDLMQSTIGSMWGTLLGYLVVIGNVQQVVVVVIIMTALVSGGVTAYSFRQRTFQLFSSAMCLPVVVCLLVRPEPMVIASILALTWYGFLLACSKKFYVFFVQAVDLFLANRDLAADLEHRNQEVSDLNRSLHKKIAELGQTNSTLVSEQERIKEFASELERLSTTDALTHIANRRCFETALDRAWTRGLRSGQEVALILMDIDYFKPYNDNYGHQAGDQCLVNVAQILQANAGLDACVARYGGEEFVVLLPHTSLFVALEHARSLVNTIAEANIVHEYSAVAPHLTMSAGVSVTRPDPSSNAKLLLEKADRALYYAKDSGRNQVVSDRAEGVIDASERPAVQLDDRWQRKRADGSI
ncbi:MAG: diguanylate cyclase [Lysobacterales bacterium]